MCWIEYLVGWRGDWRPVAKSRSHIFSYIYLTLFVNTSQVLEYLLGWREDWRPVAKSRSYIFRLRKPKCCYTRPNIAKQTTLSHLISKPNCPNNSWYKVFSFSPQYGCYLVVKLAEEFCLQIFANTNSQLIIKSLEQIFMTISHRLNRAMNQYLKWYALLAMKWH